MEHERRDGLDRLLDDALAIYASRDPRPGFERRVLERVGTEGARSWWPSLRWALPLIAMGLVLAGILLWNDHVSAPVPPKVTAISQAAKPLPRQPRTGQPRRSRLAALPKQHEFPMRTALTRQERALVAFVHSSPTEEWRTFDEAPSIMIEPLKIQEIKVEPLQASDGQE